ncbi:helix-turn-helix domain-containing protein [Anaerovorax sp. IOR16]|uniref:helix-turn-helix domain-containing protein n=1 Tax=Anaerovorax sp. IOR16 TaxID=2773458 RepID=UPI0019D0D18B|nr:helix-turn-helix domain-containing protein [Anaerovorax sp. IOR16]
MCNVLIVDNDKIERYVTKDVLKHHFDNVNNIFEAENSEEAYKLLDVSVIDLLISNLSNSGLNLMNLVKFTKQKNPNASVILTTSKSEKEVAHAVLKLKADGYLLKPFSPDLLLSIAKPYIEKNELLNTDFAFSKIEESLKQLKSGIREHLYKKCIIYAKSFLNDVYNEELDTNQRCEMVVGYLQGITEIAEEYNLDNIDIFKTITKEVKLKFEKYGLRYNSYLLVTDMLTQMFDELDKDYYYSDEITKVLNYIDRNIKFGITLEEAADYVNMSSCYFSKLFKKVTKNNFITYITNSKIELAKEMLRYTEMPIINIAYELSYNETNYFSKAFKKNVGFTPSEYRDKYLKIN